MRLACGEGLRLRVSEEAPGDEVAVSDTLEREGDVDRSSNEESELRDIIGWGWYKREKGLRTGGGLGIRMVRGEGNRGGEKNVGCQARVVGWVVGGERGRKRVGLGKEARSRACL